jgi:hypothetical protein
MPRTTRHSLMNRLVRKMSSFQRFPELPTTEPPKKAFEKPATSIQVYDSLEADNWIENNYDRWQSLLQSSVESGSNTSEAKLPPVQGPVACMREFNQPALCLFGDSKSDQTARIASELGEMSGFPVVVRPSAEYPSEVVDLE